MLALGVWHKAAGAHLVGSEDVPVGSQLCRLHGDSSGVRMGPGDLDPQGNRMGLHLRESCSHLWGSMGVQRESLLGSSRPTLGAKDWTSPWWKWRCPA